MTAVVPLQNLASRIPIIGKVKFGVFDGRRPKAIDTWRLTTSSRPFAQHFADRYGGEVKPMTNRSSPHDWEVISEATELAMALVPDGYSIGYELWSGGGCQRRCDGQTVEVLQTTGPDDVEYVPSPCICDRKGELECSLKSRLTIVLPDLPFMGGIVYESSSKNFAEESQGMLRLISQMQAQGINRGVLRLEKRKSTGNRRYTIASVGIDESLEALSSGVVTSRSLGQAHARPEISASANPSPGVDAEGGSDGSPSRHQFVPSDPHSLGSTGPEGQAPPAAPPPSSPSVEDDTLHGEGGESQSLAEGEAPDVVEAEVVEEDTVTEAQRKKFMAVLGDIGLNYVADVKPWMVDTCGVDSLKELPKATMRKWLDRLETEDGRAAFRSTVQGWSAAEDAEVVGEGEPETLGQRIERMGIGRVEAMAKATELAKQLKATKPTPYLGKWVKGGMHPDLYDQLCKWVDRIESGEEPKP